MSGEDALISHVTSPQTDASTYVVLIIDSYSRLLKSGVLVFKNQVDLAPKHCNWHSWVSLVNLTL